MIFQFFHLRFESLDIPLKFGHKIERSVYFLRDMNSHISSCLHRYFDRKMGSVLIKGNHKTTLQLFFDKGWAEEYSRLSFRALYFPLMYATPCQPKSLGKINVFSIPSLNDLILNI